MLIAFLKPEAQVFQISPSIGVNFMNTKTELDNLSFKHDEIIYLNEDKVELKFADRTIELDLN